MKKTIFTIFITALVFLGCGGGNEPTPTTNISSFSFINGQVVEKFGDNVIVQIEQKRVFDGSDFESKIANNIVNSSLFVAGLDTFIGDHKAKVSDIRGSQVTFSVAGGSYKAGDLVKIYIPKKTIAIVEFENISDEKKENIAKPVQENLTTKFVQSGQYIVVERSKIDAVFEEQKLKELNNEEAWELGKLVSADLVLTGTFAKKGSSWVVNLRMVDVTTGIIRSAVKQSVGQKEFRSSVIRETSNLYIGFNDGKFSDGWAKGAKRKKADVKVALDTVGAKGTDGSLKLDYNLKQEKSIISFSNTKQRDMSGFQGIEFYTKSEKESYARVVIHDQNYDDTKVNRFIASFGSSSKWERVRIPFSDFTLAKNFAKKSPGGDGVLDLDMTISIGFAIRGKDNSKENNTIWIDEIKLYKF